MTPDLTSRVLIALLRHTAATSEHLAVLLDDEHPSPLDELAHRLRVLGEHQLLEHRGHAWVLTDDGTHVAASLPGALALTSTPGAGVSSARPERAADLTALGVAFLRAHRAAFGAAAIEWDTQPRLRFKDSQGRRCELSPAARLGTFHRCADGLQPLKALIEMWPNSLNTDWIRTRLHAYAHFAGPDGSVDAPWCRWFGMPPHLVIAVPTASARSAAATAVLELAEHDQLVKSLLHRCPLVTLSTDHLGEECPDPTGWVAAGCASWNVRSSLDGDQRRPVIPRYL